MPTPVVMPQMGESIAEGTIVRWIKKVGDQVERDEPLFEISTDKVDAEIPAPVAGVLAEIRAKEGETVPVNSVVAVISSGRPVAAAPSSQPSAQAPSAKADPAIAAEAPVGPTRAASQASPERPSGRAPAPVSAAKPQTAGPPPAPPPHQEPPAHQVAPGSVEELI